MNENRYSNRPNNNFRRNNPRTHNREQRRVMLPSPAILEAYEELSEGATDRIIEMAEAEQLHRHIWEKKVAESAETSRKLGQVFGFLIALSLIIATIYLVNIGEKDMASTLSISGFSSLAITSLVASRMRNNDRRARKMRPNFTKKSYNQQ